MGKNLIDTILKLHQLGPLDVVVIEKLFAADAGKWEEGKHPRGKGGKFTKKGSGKVLSEKEQKTKEETEHGAAPGTKAAKKARNVKEKTRANIRSVRGASKDMARVCSQRAKEYPKGSEERAIYERYAISMSKPQPGRPTKEQSKAMTQKFLGKISSQLKPAAVERYKKDLANEPKITSDLCDIADSLGTEMYGLEYRLKKASDNDKGECRIAEKIEENIKDAKKDGIDMTYEESVAKLSDMVRYTQACTTDNLESNFKKTRAALEKKGYKPVKVKNTWNTFSLKNAYRGVNCVFESPTGTKFELQFHTPESLVGKEVQHPQYEEFRSPSTEEGRKSELGQQMYDNMARMKAPRNIGNIENYP